MKKIYNAIIVLAALGISAVVNAQNPVVKPGYTYTYPGIGELNFPNEVNHDDYGTNEDVGATKQISTPVNGTYWIKLEAFAKGQATKTNQPSDFVLVLDISGSMDEYFGRITKLKALQNAVNSFISRVNENDAYDMGGNPRASRLGHRISIVTFATNAKRESELIELSRNNSRRPSDSTGVSTLKNIVNRLDADGGTYSHRGMEQALDIMDFGKYNGEDRKMRTVILFTDGNPGLYGNWTSQNGTGSIGAWGNIQRRDDSFRTANAAISFANDIKNLATKYNVVSNVYTVSIIQQPSIQTQVYLGKASSNYLNATSMGNYDLDWSEASDGKPTAAQWGYGGTGAGIRNSSETDFALSASSAEELVNIFNALAGITGSANDTDLSSSSTTIDVISSSFTLSGSTISPDLIKVYTAPYLYDKDREGDKKYFGNLTLAKNSKDQYDYYKYTKNPDGSVTREYIGKKDVDDDIEIDSDKLKDNIIEVKGFDYTNNWCGPIYEDDREAGAQGHKVVILIPIQMEEHAVGGPNILTNEQGSGIFRSATDTEPLVPFTSPAVSLPVNLSIKKENLKNGENAKFTIKRAVIPKRPAGEDATWHPDYSMLTDWEYVTSIIVPNKDGSDVINIKGLPSTSDNGDYVYQVIEEDWSWTYTFESATGKGYVKDAAGNIEIKDIEIKNKFGVYSDQFVTNPITFTNKEEANSDTRVRHAESKVTNTFKPSATDATKGVVTTSDSKTND